MAQMYPSPLPATVRADPGRAAERKVYTALEASLDRSYSVFYSVAWLARRSASGAKDGEIDFLVAHPDRGVLLLEVKGGRVAHDGGTGIWVSVDRNGAPHRIDDPMAQLRSAKYALLEKIKELPAWVNRWVELGHGLVLPDSANPRHPLGPDAPLEIVLFADDMERLGGRIPELYAYWDHRQQHPGRYGVEGITMLTRLLAASFELRTPLGVALAEDDREILRLSEQQFRVLDLLSRQRRVAVSGGAGTGKSLLALEKAKRLATEGFRVLLTCYNRPLADYLRTSAGTIEGLEVLTFHQVCFRFAREAGIPLADPGTGDPGRTYFENAMPDALLNALNTVEYRYDVVIVDEGQDFLESWWEPLQLCLAEPGTGILYVFYDDNQRIYRRAVTFPKDLVEIPLTENHRNTRRIHALASRFYRGGALRAVGPEGREVEIVETASRAMLDRDVGRILHRLIREERVEPDHIAVLAGRILDRSALGRGRRIGAFAVTDDQDREPGKVLLETIHRFKGLERRVVVLADLEDLAEDAEALLYVGVSRPRTHLIIVATGAALARLGLRLPAA